MKILIVAATVAELNPIKQSIENHKLHEISFLISGVGPVFMSQSLNVHFANNSYDLVINVGLAGSYKPEINIGAVFQINKDRFIDIGAEQKGIGFLDLIEMELLDQNEFPFKNGWLFNDIIQSVIPSAIGLTRSLASANLANLDFICKKYPEASLESMEGASFFLACHLEKVKCIQIRSVSNYAGDRNHSNWNFKLAFNKLAIATHEILI